LDNSIDSNQIENIILNKVLSKLKKWYKKIIKRSQYLKSN
jgi:hypothetical protein